mmetsp:Transcript_97470/g.163862  ORF Transcript_97470/g.163862 Transcript_97470/m.163862 type:complete len:210 (+) Transcript_97470:1494-2123(+)
MRCRTRRLRRSCSRPARSWHCWSRTSRRPATSCRCCAATTPRASCASAARRSSSLRPRARAAIPQSGRRQCPRRHWRNEPTPSRPRRSMLRQSVLTRRPWTALWQRGPQATRCCTAACASPWPIATSAPAGGVLLVQRLRRCLTSPPTIWPCAAASQTRFSGSSSSPRPTPALKRLCVNTPRTPPSRPCSRCSRTPRRSNGPENTICRS